MINPTFKDTVTLYHPREETENGQTVTKWVRKVFKECFFGENIAENLTGNTLSPASSYTVRIPFAGETVAIAPGDVIVKGSVTDEVEDVAGKRVNDLLAKYRPDAFTVRAVSDNTKIPQGAHYKAVGV